MSYSKNLTDYAFTSEYRQPKKGEFYLFIKGKTMSPSVVVGKALAPQGKYHILKSRCPKLVHLTLHHHPRYLGAETGRTYHKEERNIMSKHSRSIYIKVDPRTIYADLRLLETWFPSLRWFNSNEKTPPNPGFNIERSQYILIVEEDGQIGIQHSSSREEKESLNMWVGTDARSRVLDARSRVLDVFPELATDAYVAEQGFYISFTDRRGMYEALDAAEQATGAVYAGNMYSVGAGFVRVKRDKDDVSLGLTTGKPHEGWPVIKVVTGAGRWKLNVQTQAKNIATPRLLEVGKLDRCMVWYNLAKDQLEWKDHSMSRQVLISLQTKYCEAEPLYIGDGPVDVIAHTVDIGCVKSVRTDFIQAVLEKVQKYRQERVP